MKTPLLALILTAALPWPLSAQVALTDGPLAGKTTCGQFIDMNSVDQMNALMAIQPLGDEMNAGDVGGSRQWVAAVTAACAGHPDRRLATAATQALDDN